MPLWGFRDGFLYVLSGALFCVVSVGQTPTATGAAVPTIKTGTQTVLVDVVVGDGSGRAVPALKQGDFAVFEDGKPQAITYFEAHGGAATRVGTVPKLPEGMYSNFPAEVKSDAINVVLLDSLNTPTQDQMMVRKEMIAYLKAIPPGTRIAIFTLASHLRMVNGFTTDPEVLLNALNRKGGIEGVDISPILITPEEQQSQEKRQDQVLSAGNIGNANSSPEQRMAALAQINTMRQFVSDTGSFNDDIRVKETLAAMDQLGRYLSPFPGRKNLIWFSASFPIGVDPDFNQTDAYRMMRDYSMDVRATAQRLAAARVAVYPIDARRFFQNPVLAPSHGGASSLRNGYYQSQAEDLAFDQVTKEHDTMDAIAQDTGGKAIYNTNDLKGAMADVIKNGDQYYTLAYDPASVKQDGKFHKIEVRLAQPGYKLLYRHGYVAPDAKAVAKGKLQPDKEQSTRAGGIFRAEMEPGAPPSSELLFRIQSAVEEKQPMASDAIKGDNPRTTKPVTRYVFGYATDVGHTQMVQTEDGIRHGMLMTMVIAYDQQGKPLNSILNTQKLDLEPKVYADALRTGLPFYQELDIPNGDVTVRIGVYDVASGKMGALEFPLTVKPQAVAGK